MFLTKEMEKEKFLKIVKGNSGEVIISLLEAIFLNFGVNDNVL